MELVGLRVSPYTFRARLALDHHQIPYRYHEHLVMLEEPLLMWRLKSFKPITVPILFHPKGAIMDSYDIARFADQMGGGSSLFPEKDEKQIDDIHALANQVTDLGRALYLHRLLNSPEAQIENIPFRVSPSIKPVFKPLVVFALKYIQWSFDMKAFDYPQTLSQIREALLKIRAIRNGKSTLLDQLTFADYTAAQALHFISLPPEPILKSAPYSRECATVPELASEFQDLVEWRNSLYERTLKKRTHASILKA